MIENVKPGVVGVVDAVARHENAAPFWAIPTRLAAKGEEKVPAQFDGKILVPFPIESALSGVMKPLRPEQRLW